MNITLTKHITENKFEQWSFWFYDSRETLVLDSYKVMQRESHRHKFKPVKQYSRLDNRDINPLIRLKLEDVPFDQDIGQQAIAELASRIKVGVMEDHITASNVHELKLVKGERIILD